MPQPARPSRRARHPIVIAGNAVFTTIVVLAIVAGIAMAIGKQRFEAPGPLEQEKVVNIPRGLGVRDIADYLQREGVIDQPWVFVGGVLFMKAKDDLKYGEYAFAKQASLRDVIDTIVQGKVVQHLFTVPEGLTSEQIVARLLENNLLTGSVKEIPPEGTLLPDSYRFTRGTSRELIIQRMQQAQRRLVTEVWERRSPDLPIKTPEQLVTLASIVEKETGRPDERTRIAAVFMNRLKQKMKLQSDPTIIYGLVGGKGSLGRPIMRSEIEQPTPYNTYVIPGLPPGPIANPGRAAIEATASPSRTKELFFVADGTGGHAFSETGDQHSRNVSRLRQLEQQNREAKSAQEAAQDATTGDKAPDATSTTSANADQQPDAPAASPTPRPRPVPRNANKRQSSKKPGTRQE
ncbi:MAG: endolytic transglycosylase MltG [Variibacter sp.]